MEKYTEFLKNFTDFIFLEDVLEPADVIFVPGNGYPQMAERAAALWKAGYAPFVLPSGKYSVTLGHFSGGGGQIGAVSGALRYGMGVSGGCADEKRSAPGGCFAGGSGHLYLAERAVFPEGYRRGRHSGQKGHHLLPGPSCPPVPDVLSAGVSRRPPDDLSFPGYGGGPGQLVSVGSGD